MFGFLVKCKGRIRVVISLLALLWIVQFVACPRCLRSSQSLRAFGCGRRDMLSGSRIFSISCLETLDTNVRV